MSAALPPFLSRLLKELFRDAAGSTNPDEVLRGLVRIEQETERAIGQEYSVRFNLFDDRIVLKARSAAGFLRWHVNTPTRLLCGVPTAWAVQVVREFSDSGVCYAKA
jgi:hypothetical protein